MGRLYGPVSSWESRAAHRAARRALRESRFGFRESAELSQRRNARNLPARIVSRTDWIFRCQPAPSAFEASPRLGPSPRLVCPYSTGTHGATCSRGRICYTHACSPARARAPAAPPSPRRRPGRPRGCGRTRPASKHEVRVIPPPLGRPRERRGVPSSPKSPPKQPPPRPPPPPCAHHTL